MVDVPHLLSTAVAPLPAADVLPQATRLLPGPTLSGQAAQLGVNVANRTGLLVGNGLLMAAQTLGPIGLFVGLNYFAINMLLGRNVLKGGGA